MKFQIAPLAIRKPSDIGRAPRINSEAGQRSGMNHWRYQDVAVVVETDEAPVEQVIGVGGEQQTVFTVQPLLVA